MLQQKKFYCGSKKKKKKKKNCLVSILSVISKIFEKYYVLNIMCFQIKISRNTSAVFEQATERKLFGSNVG